MDALPVILNEMRNRGFADFRTWILRYVQNDKHGVVIIAKVDLGKGHRSRREPVKGTPAANLTCWAADLGRVRLRPPWALKNKFDKPVAVFFLPPFEMNYAPGIIIPAIIIALQPGRGNSA